MDAYKRYLAEKVLSEDKVITYRALSRALQVHVNIAKQMLYDFHSSQNDKHPGAVHATYLLYGITKPDAAPAQPPAGEDGDIEMASSLPEIQPPDEVVATITMALVPEQQLNDVLATYDEITSIHIYSLGPHEVKDMALLSDAARQLVDLPAEAAPSETPTNYGTIANPYVRRRERRGAGPKPAAVGAPRQPEPKPPARPPVKVQEELKASPLAPAKGAAASVTTVPARKPPVPTLKRGGSGIMQSFAKAAAAKAKKSETPQPATPSADDSSMHPMSDGEEDDSAILPQPKTRDGPERKSKKEREEELRRMMEEDDDEGKEEQEEEEEKEEEEEEQDGEESPAQESVEGLPAPEPTKEEPAEIISVSGGGRRRGRRRVMKKKQTVDEKGYLVTTQEPGWESFSEDEAPPPAAKPKPVSSASATQASKTKKSGAKANQGSIMSFFSKK